MNTQHTQHTYASLAVTVVAIFVCAIPSFVVAATAELFFDAPDVQNDAVTVGSTIRVPAMVRAADAPGINVLDATVVVSGPARIVALQTGGSVFSLWPAKDISGNGTRMHIVGGTPSSVFGNRLRAIDLVLQVNGEGTVTLDSSEAIAYVGDGTGAEIAVVSQPMSFDVVAGQSVNDQASYLALDTQPPDTFSIELSRDASVFNGAYFLSFFTTDAQTGVVRYEVTEGSRPVVDSDGTYVLYDQTLATDVVVRAYDGAGNVREETFTTQKALQDISGTSVVHTWKWVIMFVGSILAILLLGVGARRRWRKRT